MSLGGPIAAGLVALVGATQLREVRRQVPWYGVLANHAGITGPAVLGAYALGFAGMRWPEAAASARLGERNPVLVAAAA